MAKVWQNSMGVHQTQWALPPAGIAELNPLIVQAENILAQLVVSPDRTSVITAKANRIFGELCAHLGFIKDHYFKSSLLVEEDFISLLLNIPDTTRMPRGNPCAQMTAEIKRSGTDMLILAYKYVEGTERLADPHTDISRQVR
jgi:hypothetical protein